MVGRLSSVGAVVVGAAVAQPGSSSGTSSSSSSSSSGSAVTYASFKLDLSPFGGSLVIFTALCRIDTGNSFAGMLVSHRRKSLCTRSGLNSTVMVSRTGSHDR